MKKLTQLFAVGLLSVGVVLLWGCSKEQQTEEASDTAATEEQVATDESGGDDHAGHDHGEEAGQDEGDHAGHSHGDEAGGAEAQPADVVLSNPEDGLDPVCGMAVTAASTIIEIGEKYYATCSANCAEQLQADPDKYLKVASSDGS